MKIRRSTLGIVTLLAAFSTFGQGTFVFDQQSSTNETPLLGGVQVPGFPGLGDGQSFTPALPSVGFIRLLFNGNGGATVYVNLRSDSINGPIIGTSDSVTMGLSGAQSFVFTTPVGVRPGIPYYFEAVQTAGTAWNFQGGQYNYAGGTAYWNGVPNYAQDFWFREGIIVPEPCSAALLLMAGTAFWVSHRSNRK